LVTLEVDLEEIITLQTSLEGCAERCREEGREQQRKGKHENARKDFDLAERCDRLNNYIEHKSEPAFKELRERRLD
jgi:hypothetical protein